MEPLPTRTLEQLESGQFLLPNRTKNVVTLLAIDQQSELGAVVFISKTTPRNLNVQLAPLVQVTGELTCNESIPEWTHAFVYAIGSPEIPD